MAPPPPPRSCTNWTRLVLLPVLTGHVPLAGFPGVAGDRPQALPAGWDRPWGWDDSDTCLQVPPLSVRVRADTGSYLKVVMPGDKLADGSVQTQLSLPSRTNWTRLVPRPVLIGHADLDPDSPNVGRGPWLLIPSRAADRKSRAPQSEGPDRKARPQHGLSRSLRDARVHDAIDPVRSHEGRGAHPRRGLRHALGKAPRLCAHVPAALGPPPPPPPY